MRRFLLISACAFSFCVRAQTNIVELTQEQWNTIRQFCSLIIANNWGYSYLENGSNGSLVWDDGLTDFQDFMLVNQLNQQTLVEFLHLILTGTIRDSYDSSANNILAYASSLRSHNAEVRQLLDSIEQYAHGSYLQISSSAPYVGSIYNSLNGFRSDYTNNFEKLYAVLTNLDFNVSFSNQLEMLQVMDGNISNHLYKISDYLLQLVYGYSALGSDILAIQDNDNRLHGELMDFLHSLSNSALFATNLCNCSSNLLDSIFLMLDWMTNNWNKSDLGMEIDGVDFSNLVWTVWRPSDSPSGSGWGGLYVPTVEWISSGPNAQYKPQYGTNQYDMGYNAIWEQYQGLLQEYRADGIDGQQFLAGLVDLQLHIMANMSTQLYMIDSKMPSKTNLWDWIEQYKSEVNEEVNQAQTENDEAASSASALLDYTPFSVVGGHFPKVSSALRSLKVDADSSPVLRIPIPRALRVSDADELVVDVRESEWYSTGRNWCRWVFSFIWGWLFIRLGLVPVFYIFFFTVRVAEISAHLVFLGSVRGSSGIVSSFGASAVDMVLSLIGIDTDFKRFVWGIMRD